jgi:hypothetical protein
MGNSTTKSKTLIKSNERIIKAISLLNKALIQKSMFLSTFSFDGTTSDDGGVKIEATIWILSDGHKLSDKH